jgi:hypothetical protein
MNDETVAATAREMAALLRRFVAGDVEPYEWDDLMGIEFGNQFLEEMRVRANVVLDTLPPDDGASDDKGATALLEVAADLEREASTIFDQH